MLITFRRLLSPSTLIATLAVVLAAGGTASAAHLITGAQVKNGSLTGADIRSKSVPGGDLKDGAVTSTKLSPDVLSLIGKPGPAGPTGLTGPTGATGATGAAGTTSLRIRISATTSVAANASGAAAVSCEAGEHATGGGVSSGGIEVGESFPTVANGSNPTPGGLPTGWRVSGKNTTAAAIAMSAYAVCVAS